MNIYRAKTSPMGAPIYVIAYSYSEAMQLLEKRYPTPDYQSDYVDMVEILPSQDILIQPTV